MKASIGTADVGDQVEDFELSYETRGWVFLARATGLGVGV
jgi:hypothetical protein